MTHDGRSDGGTQRLQRRREGAVRVAASWELLVNGAHGQVRRRSAEFARDRPTAAVVVLS